MFGLGKKQCAVCGKNPVLNVGKPLGHLCETHMLGTYKTRFLAHSGRKVIVPPTTPNKHTSYQYETIASLKSYGWNAGDIAPLEVLFSRLPASECLIMQSDYKIQELPNFDLFGSANWRQKPSIDAVKYVLSALPAYMSGSGVAMPPEGDEDILFYPMQA